MIGFQMTSFPFPTPIAFENSVTMGSSSTIENTLCNSGRMDVKFCSANVWVSMVEAGDVVDGVAINYER